MIRLHIKLEKSSSIINISGQYIPKRGEYFRVSEKINEIYQRADLIISHGGAGTLLQNLYYGKIIVAVCNNTLQGNHQL